MQSTSKSTTTVQSTKVQSTKVQSTKVQATTTAKAANLAVIRDLYQYTDLMPSAETLHNPNLMYREMGAQPISFSHASKRVSGVRFLVFAPNASSVSVIGDFNQWDANVHSLQKLDQELWGIFIADLAVGERYKFALCDSYGNSLPHKTDPWGAHAEQYPSFASLVYDQDEYQWQDADWQQRAVTEKHKEALSFYELHAGSWLRNDEGEFLTYRQLAEKLIPYLLKMNYTHVELMPISEHPFYGSWGYQPIGMFSPTSRFGSPDDFKYFIDQCHQVGLGVIIDWVPAHFPSDEHGLANFDGTPLFNDPDPKRGWHQDWQSYIYDCGRDHVQRFLVSNSLYWLEQFHVDGIRVDAVASMLYLDYSRNDGEWIPNCDGGNHNYDAIKVLKWMNEEVYTHYPNAMTIAEESTAFPGVSKPTFLGGLGFGFKWNMGWMHDSLSYIQEDPINRKYHHNTITFPLVYAFSENYVLALSHDEVVYGKGSLFGKMPGDEWQKFANLRAYTGYMYGQPGKKLNFMGAEIGQLREWNHDGQLDWGLLQSANNAGIQQLTADLNKLYQSQTPLHQLDCDPAGFEWRLQDSSEDSILAHERVDEQGNRILVVTNFTPLPRDNFRLGVPNAGQYELLLNTDAPAYAGSDYPVMASVDSEQISSEGLNDSVLLNLPPLATLFYRLRNK